MSKPVSVELSPELAAIKERWLTADRIQRDEIFRLEFGEPFARLFAELPLHNAPAGLKDRPSALISVLGFSWQPVALMAAWVRPERMLLLGTRESLEEKYGNETVIQIVSRVSHIDAERIEKRVIAGDAEFIIYRETKAFIQRYNLSPRKVAVDPTGGKKSMSVSAGLAGFLSGSLLVYVDNTGYDTEKRIPIAGSEYPRLLSNPLSVFGDLEFDKIKNAFNRGDFQEASNLACNLSEKLYEPRLAEIYHGLAEGYKAWSRFEFILAKKKLDESRGVLDEFATIAGWNWVASLVKKIEENLTVLEVLVSIKERPKIMSKGAPLILNHLASAFREFEKGRYHLVQLLAYATVEKFVDLHLYVAFDLDDDKPDYSLIERDLDLSVYHGLGRRMHGKQYDEQPPNGKLTFARGLRLLAALKPDLLSGEDLVYLQNLATERNKGPYEHGLFHSAVKPAKIKSQLNFVRNMIEKSFNNSKCNVTLSMYVFPVLE